MTAGTEITYIANHNVLTGDALSIHELASEPSSTVVAERVQYDVSGWEKWRRWSVISILLALSWWATYDGVLKYISSSATVTTQLNIVVTVATVTIITLILYSLDEIFAARGRKSLNWFGFVAFYLFLTFISTGFSFGFYWSWFNARTFEDKKTADVTASVVSKFYSANNSLQSVTLSLKKLEKTSSELSIKEKTLGGTCDDGNKSGRDGPRTGLRERDAADAHIAFERLDQAAQTIRGDARYFQDVIESLQGTTGSVGGLAARRLLTGEEREQKQNELRSRLDSALGGYDNARITAQNVARSFRERANRHTFIKKDYAPDTRDGSEFTCRDANLEATLSGLAIQLDSLPIVPKPEIEPGGDAKRVTEAFSRLLTEVKVVPLRIASAVGLLSSEAVSLQSTDGLRKEDYMPLFLAIFVDAGLFVVSMNRRRPSLRHLPAHLQRDQGQDIAEAVRRLAPFINGPSFNARYLVRHWQKFYVVIPERINGTVDDHALLDRSMNTAFIAMSDLDIMRQVRWKPFLNISRKLAAKGHAVDQDAKFVIYQMNEGVIPELFRSLILTDAPSESGEYSCLGVKQQPSTNFQSMDGYSLQQAEHAPMEAFSNTDGTDRPPG